MKIENFKKMFNAFEKTADVIETLKEPAKIKTEMIKLRDFVIDIYIEEEKGFEKKEVK